MTATSLGRAARELRELSEAIERLDHEVDMRLAGYAELAKLTGLTRAALRVKQTRGQLPTPIDVIDAGPIWRLAEIEDWLERQQETFE